MKLRIAKSKKSNQKSQNRDQNQGPSGQYRTKKGRTALIVKRRSQRNQNQQRRISMKVTYQEFPRNKCPR